MYVSFYCNLIANFYRSSKSPLCMKHYDSPLYCYTMYWIAFKLLIHYIKKRNISKLNINLLVTFDGDQIIFVL